MEYHRIKDIIYVKQLLGNKRIENTLKHVQLAEERFLNFTNKTPNELIKQRHDDLKKDDPREQRAIECLLKAYMVELKKQGKSPATQQIAFAAVKSFFEANEYPLRTKKSDYPTGESLGVRAITKQQIKQILEDTKRMKDKRKICALIMFLKDSGLGVSDVGNLKVGVVRQGLDANLEYIPLQLLRQKTKTIVKTFLGPEAIAALKDYLQERREGTQRIAPETLTDNSPLFRCQLYPSGLLCRYQFHHMVLRVRSLLDSTAIPTILRTASEKLRLCGLCRCIGLVLGE